MAPSQVKFQFVTVTSSAPALTAETRGLIKKHVMKDIGLSRRKYGLTDTLKQPVTEETRRTLLDSRSKIDPIWLPDEEGAAPRSVDGCKPLVGPLVCLSHPAIDIGVGIPDPFNSYPIQGNSEVDLLIDHSENLPTPAKILFHFVH